MAKELRYKTGSTENKPPHYLPIYQRYLADITAPAPVILELGVHRGDSLEMLADYFPAALVLGVDANAMDLAFSTPRIKAYQGLQDDPALHERILAENKITVYDLIMTTAPISAAWRQRVSKSCSPSSSPAACTLLKTGARAIGPNGRKAKVSTLICTSGTKVEFFPAIGTGCPDLSNNLWTKWPCPTSLPAGARARATPACWNTCTSTTAWLF